MRLGPGVRGGLGPSLVLAAAVLLWSALLVAAQAPLVVAEGEAGPTGPSATEVEKGLDLSWEERRLVQRGLAAAGQDPGYADGVFGSRTRGALRAWQEAGGLEGTGYLTREQTEELAALGLEVEEEMRRKLEEEVERLARKYPAGTTLRDCPECPEMVVVPEGTYMKGSPEMGGMYFNPVYEATIARPFAVGVKEVTRGEFARFVSATGHPMGDSCRVYGDGEWEERSGRSWRHPGFSQTDEHPAACVSWDDAKAYVGWLSGRTGENYRLLSDVEWEYVARAGTKTAYWWGDDIGRNRANCDGCGSRWDARGTAPVGSFPANPFGLHDVLGNVWEWVEDCYLAYCTQRVLRGGSWGSRPMDLRSALRAGHLPDPRYFLIGFRVARTLTP